MRGGGTERRTISNPTNSVLTPYTSAEGLLDDLLLLDLVASGGACGRACRGWAEEAGEGEPVEEPLAEAAADVGPRAHVLGLFLHPEDRGLGAESGEGCADHLFGQRVELLEPQDRDVFALLVGAVLLELVVELAAAEEHAREL